MVKNLLIIGSILSVLIIGIFELQKNREQNLIQQVNCPEQVK